MAEKYPYTSPRVRMPMTIPPERCPGLGSPESPMPYVVYIPRPLSSAMEKMVLRMEGWAFRNKLVIGVPMSKLPRFFTFATAEAAEKFQADFVSKAKPLDNPKKKLAGVEPGITDS